MIKSYTLKKQLGIDQVKTKTELFEILKKNESKLINIKTKKILKSNKKGISIFSHSTAINKELNKTNKDITIDEDYYYIVVNSTKILDNHEDLHLPKIWNRSAKNQNKKNYFVADHQTKVKSIISYPKDTEIFIAELSFKSMGLPFEGSAECLIYKIKIFR